MQSCDALTPDNRHASMVLRRSSGDRHADPASAAFAHLFLHRIHHRGQARAMQAGTNVAPPQLDEFFLGEDALKRRPDLVALELP